MPKSDRDIERQQSNWNTGPMSAEPTLPVSQPDFEPIAVDLARELYDRFVMGGWTPADAHAEIILTLVRWYEGFSQERDRELQQAREEIARLKEGLLAELERLDGTLRVSKKFNQGQNYNTGWTNGKKFSLDRVKAYIEKSAHPVPEKPKS